MLELKQKSSFENYGLLFQNGEWTFTKSLAEVVVFPLGDVVRIRKNVRLTLFDDGKLPQRKIIVESEASLNYQMIFKENSRRQIDNFGSVHIMEISLASKTEELQVNLLQADANAEVEVLAIASATSQTFHQQVIHSALRTTSNISNFAVAFRGAKILFDTVGAIQKGNAKSVCRQLSKGIVMDDTSSVISKPILYIDEYDMVANHGASIGKMSDESLFYLMSRGLSKTEAFLLILEGIISPFLRQISDETIKNQIEKEVRNIIKEG